MISLYSSASCSKCSTLKAQLEKENLEFEVIDDVQKVLDEMDKALTMSVPFVKVNGKYIISPSINRIKEEL